jgi:dihydroorotate dehydrogenase (fumarate)
MNTTTKYLGLELKNPVVVSSSGLTGSYDKVMEIIEHGAGAIVLKSLFEEQIINDIEGKLQDDEMYFWYPEATDFVKNISKEHGVNQYIKFIKKIKANTATPVIASVNCTTSQQWPQFAKELQGAGADALELNIAIFPHDETIESRDIENLYVEIVAAVKQHVQIPVAVKLGAQFTNIPHMVSRLDAAGVQGLVLFNRFFRPDIDIETGKIKYNNYLSDPAEMTQSLRWISLLAPKTRCDLIANTGIHDYKAIVKQLMAGASAVQLTSVLYKKGVPYLATLIGELQEWMKRKNIDSIDKIHLNTKFGSDHAAEFERIQFMRRTVDLF